MPKKLLIVDDEVQLCKLLKRRLTRAGFDVLVAYNGIEAIETTKAHKPDAILLDIKMTPQSGLEVLQELRSMPAFKNLPIIVMSAKDQIAEIQKGIECGATEYLCKPIPTQAIVTALNHYLAD